ncbi:hypothetical protein GCM10023346_41130 [Arthrobacter gyeryongensis]|uniref:Uncharacterized protein n=1 Tax=Arthrobacter gyeryongensis TaxID=1650592 RepID=A0ABP9SQD6_9MICC
MQWLWNAYRFPKQSVSDLVSLEYVYLIIAVGWTVIGIFRLPGWPGYLDIIYAIFVGTLSLAARKEIRRRQESGPQTK